MKIEKEVSVVLTTPNITVNWVVSSDEAVEEESCFVNIAPSKQGMDRLETIKYLRTLQDEIQQVVSKL